MAKGPRRHESEGLTPRERVLRAVQLEEPDRVPVYITITPQLAEKVSRHLGVSSYTLADSPLSQNRISFHELLLELGNDMVCIGACAPKGNPTREIAGGLLVNEWCVKFKKIGYYAEMVEHPLARAETVAEIEDFPFPDPCAEGRFTLAERVVERYGDHYAICGDVECTVFEASWYLTGFEKFLMDLSLGKHYIFALMDRVMNYSIDVGRKLIRMGADIIWLGDDVGTQQGMLVSPTMWRRHLKGRLEIIIQTLKKEKPGIKIAYHCCGSYFPIILDLIEVGVDILNALQPTARGMELSKLKEQFGDQVSFFGGLDTQGILPFGSLQDVDEEVKRVYIAAGSGGGLILAGAHNLQPDVSLAKVIRLFEAAKNLGRYPLSLALRESKK